MNRDPGPPLLRTQPFLVRDALPEVGRARLRRRDVLALARGLRVPAALGDRLTPHHFEPLLGPSQHFSHLTAAALWCMPVPASDSLHVTTVGDGPVMRRSGVIGHRVARAAARIDVVFGLAVTAPADAWAECATLLSVDELIVAGDYLVGRHGDLGHGNLRYIDLDHTDLEAAVLRRRGRRGCRALRAALAQICVGSESARETRLRLQLLRAGFRLPLLNCPIHDTNNRFVARPDIIFGRERVCVEYDGDHHRTNRRTYRDDKRRREALADAGWHTLYLSDDDLNGDNWLAFVGRLARALERGEAAARLRDGLR